MPRRICRQNALTQRPLSFAERLQLCSPREWLTGLGRDGDLGAEVGDTKSCTCEVKAQRSSLVASQFGLFVKEVKS